MMYQLKLEINQQNLRTKLFGIVFCITIQMNYKIGLINVN